MILGINGIIAGKGTSIPLLDIYTGAAAAYSLRKLRTAYTGNAITVRRSSDNTSQQIGFDANGNLDTATLLSFVGAGNGFVSTWFDQSGNGRNATQATAANQPQIISGGVLYMLNDKPIVRNPTANSSKTLSTPLSTLQTRPISIVTAAKIYALPTNIYNNVTYLIGGTGSVGGGSRYELNASNNGFSANRRTGYSVLNGTFNTNPFIMQGHFASSTITNRRNGVDVTGYVEDTNQLTTGTNFVLLGGSPFENSIQSNIGMFEVIFYLSDKTSDRIGIESNINSFYSIY